MVYYAILSITITQNARSRRSTHFASWARMTKWHGLQRRLKEALQYRWWFQQLKLSQKCIQVSWPCRLRQWVQISCRGQSNLQWTWLQRQVARFRRTNPATGQGAGVLNIMAGYTHWKERIGWGARNDKQCLPAADARRFRCIIFTSAAAGRHVCIIATAP